MISTLLKKCSNGFNSIVLLTLLLFGFIGSNALQAQVATNYTFQDLQISPAYADLVAATKTQIFTGAWNDNAPTSIPIGFTFNFNGLNYTTLTVSPNGFVYFGTASATPAIATVYDPISSANTYAGAIAAYGANLSVGSAAGTPQVNSVAYFLDTTGGAGNSILKIEWGFFRRTAAETNFMRSQIWLYQNGNVIEVRYKDLSALSTTLVTGQVGLRGTSNTDFNNRKWAPAVAAVWPSTLTPTVPPTMSAGAVNTDGVQTKNTILPNTNSNRLFRWSPVTCFLPTSIAVSAVTNSTATVTWVAPSPAPVQYQYEVRTSGAAGSGPVGLAQSGNIASSPLNLTLLSGGTPYTVYIRSDCGSSVYSAWSTGVPFTTLCNPSNLPYFMYFDEGDALYPYTVPALPLCTSIQNVGVGPLNVWKTSYATAFSNTAQFFDEHLLYDATTGTGGTDDANVWFFTKGLNLVAGTTYRIAYDYGGSTETSTITNKLLVKYGSYPSDAAMTAGTLIANHDNIKASPLHSSISFTATTTGVFYFGFKAYSAKNNGRLFLDNIEITEPGCVKPTAVTANSITGSSALITWTAPTPAPGSGYAYYLTTTNPIKTAGTFVIGTTYQILTVGTTDYTLIGATSNAIGVTFTATGVGAGTGTAAAVPSYTQAPTGYTSAGTTLVNLSALTGSTTYYIWVRSYCSAGDFSEWSIMQTFTTLFQPAYCIPSNAITTSYFSNFVTTGAIANISNPSGFSPGGYGNYTTQFASQAAGGTVNFNTGIVGPTVGVAIYIDWNNDGTFAVGERVFNTAAYVTTCSGSFTVPGAQAVGDYRMRIVMDWLATSPLPCTFSSAGEAEDYTFKVVPPPPPLTISSSSSTQCAGVNSPLVTLTSLVGNYNSYSWSPSSGVSGNEITGYTFNSNTTITYTLTGTQTVAPYGSKTVTFTYNANPLPTPIVITPNTTTTCQAGPAVLLSATGGIVSGIPVMTEDFNTGAPTWTTVNNSTLGTPANAAWTIQSSGYNPGGSSGIASVVSNDSTQFYISNSDSQGSGSNTDVTLYSPIFSLASYTNASLSFFHYYKPWINGQVKVDIFNGSSWVTLQSWGNSSTTSAQGTPTSFDNVIINLNAYAGLSGLQLRFNYTASWGFVWAVDNVLVSGSASSSINWNLASSPVANGVVVPGLYTNSTATTQYVAGTGSNTVYVMPNATTTFTASASTPSPTVCSTTTNVVVNVTPIVGGTASSNQSICYGAASGLTLSGYSGTITGWQYANDLAFTSGVTAIPASASATLSSAQIGILTADRYFRAVVTNGVCTAYSTVVSITISATHWNGSAWSNGIPTSTKQAIFDDDYTASADPALVGLVMNACSVLVTGGTVTFDSGYTLNVQNIVDCSSGDMIFENNASLVQVNTMANLGSITYKRNTTPVRLFDYTYWSSPVAPQTLVALSPLTLSDKYFRFDPTINNWVSVGSFNLMDSGKGYIIRAPQGFSTTVPSVFNGTFYGVPNNGTITTPIVLSVGDFNLIGNPYPSALDIDLFMADPANVGVVGGTIYLWTHNTIITGNNYFGSDYAVYNYLGGVGTTGAPGANNSIPTGKVAAGQGFFIKALANGVATFKNTMRVVGNNSQFYKSSNGKDASVVSDRNRLWLDVYNNQGAYKQTLLGYVANATNGIDREFDSEILDAGNVVSLYSLVDNAKLAIQGRAMPFDVNDIVPLGFKSTVNGTFEIRLSNFDGLFENQNIYLVDKLLNVEHNLKDSNYTFVTNSGTFESRFQLRFTSSSLVSDTNVFDENTVVVYKQNQNIYINSSNTQMKSLEVYDIRGRKLFDKQNVNSSEFVISGLNSAQQVLLIKISSVDGKIATKKIIF